MPRGYIRFLGKLAELADSGVQLTWVTGNHDVWLFDYLRDQLNMTVLKGHTVVDIDGRLVFISHGDDVGRQPAMYRFTRWCFYNPVCQWLYAAIHPRWTYPIATGWSNENRTHRNPDEQKTISERAASRLMDFSRDYFAAHPEVTAFVYGHIHLARINSSDTMPPVIMLGEWISLDSYVILTPDGRFSLHYFEQ